MKIMIVEDESDIQRYIARALKDFGTEFWLPQNGQEAYHMIIEQDMLPDLLITDIDMPVLDGFELIKKLSEKLSQMPPIIVITGNEHNASPARKLGAESVILKPFHVDELLEDVIKIFS